MQPFLRSVLVLLRGSALSQVVMVAALPLLARFYRPEQFGVAAAVLSFLTILLIVGSLRLEVALLSVPETDLATLVRCAIWLALLINMGAFVPVAVIAICDNARPPEQRAALLLLPFVGLFASWNQVASYLTTRRKDFAAAANARVVQAFGYAGIALAGGLVRPASATLLLADGLARAVAAAYSVRRLAPLRATCCSAHAGRNFAEFYAWGSANSRPWGSSRL